MIRELKDTYNYPRVITLISVLSVAFGLVNCYLGEIFLPFSSSFLAILFLFEKPNKRILSYVCPAVSIIFAVLLKGTAAIINVECVLLALVLVFCYKKSVTKAETSVYLTLIVSVFVLISLYLSAASAIESFSFAAVREHYVKIFLTFKNDFIAILSDFTLTTKDGTVENAMSVEEAASYFKALSNIFVALIGIFSFLISGIALKVYTALVLKYSKHGILKKFAHFIPSNLCAYSYLISSVLAFFFSESLKFGIILSNINAIMMVVFAYMGLKYLLMVAKISQRRSLIYFLIIAGVLSFSSFAPSIISYLGIWVVIGTNSHNKLSQD